MNTQLIPLMEFDSADNYQATILLLLEHWITSEDLSSDHQERKIIVTHAKLIIQMLEEAKAKKNPSQD